MIVILVRPYFSARRRIAWGSQREVTKIKSRKKLIVESVRKLFFAKGLNSVTVDEIARYSELGKGFICLYFNSKEEIYAQILLNDIEKFNRHALAFR